ncbi:MAG: hypothetical protein OJF49_004406 [Ktedonobacterales bacterium]|nr:MAG: hypothetical protein OJF49_004406 [Ktedonobacterales bacterium]
MITIESYLRSMEATFVPEKCQRTHAVLQYVFTGSQCGVCHAIIGDGTITTAIGAHPAPSAIVTSDFDLWMRLLAYEQDPLLAYQGGWYQVEGDVTLLMESDAWFARVPR